jgi:acyl carrier protein
MKAIILYSLKIQIEPKPINLMKRESVKAVVTEFLAQLNECSFSPEEIQESHNLKDDIGADSLDFVEMVILCEKEFNIGISDDDISGAEHGTVGEFISIVESKIQ